ncbi:MAG TPA: hypothetical protein VF235_00850 [Actinomycetota bacterium]
MESKPSGWAVGWTFFAAFMMMMLGCWWAFAGLVGIFNDEFYVEVADYWLKLDISTWAWVHLLMGVVVVLAALALFSGAVWARTVGVILAVLSGLLAFAWLPWYPIWGILFIVASIGVIWALTAHGHDAAAE